MSFSRFMFLGTASAVPRPGHRNVSAMLLQFSCGSLTLIDCGEATQHQLMRSTVRMGSIDNILLTHLHGDHCFGLFGLMHTLNMGGRKSAIQIYGPSGTDELVRTVFRLTGGWNGFEIKVTELEPNNVHKFDIRSGTLSEQVLASVIACPMVHRLPSFGYVISEPEQARTLDGSKAMALGATGSDLGRLKSGQDVILANGSVVESASVTYPGRRARTVAVMQDTSDASSALPYMQGVDLLVHEATYEKSLEAQAVEYGHSTAEMAAKIARQSDAGILALTHFSSRYGENIDLLKKEAEAQLEGVKTKVVLGEDFMCFSGDSLSELSSIRKPE